MRLKTLFSLDLCPRPCTQQHAVSPMRHDRLPPHTTTRETARDKSVSSPYLRKQYEAVWQN